MTLSSFPILCPMSGFLLITKRLHDVGAEWENLSSVIFVVRPTAVYS